MSKFLLPLSLDSDIFVTIIPSMIVEPRARIVAKKSWKNYFLLSLETSRLTAAIRPGQFIMVRIGAYPYPLLRRPFSIHSHDGKIIEIFFQTTGVGTSFLSQKEVGDFLDIFGPLGKGFSVGPGFQGKEVAVVGGGRGIAPLYFLARTLRSYGASVKIFYGGRSLEDLPLRIKFEAEGFDLRCSTDDGSYGYKGLVSDFLAEELENLSPAQIFACGPEAMMRKISQIAQTRNTPAEFSLESVMGCGFGVCWGCVKRIKKNGKESWVKICEEGPVFPGEEITWADDEP